MIPASQANEGIVQYSLFDDMEAIERKWQTEQKQLKKENELQKAMLTIKERFGKNAILKGVNFMEGATAIERNGQVGGHRA